MDLSIEVHSSRNLSLKKESRLSRNPETTKKNFFLSYLEEDFLTI